MEDNEIFRLAQETAELSGLGKQLSELKDNLSVSLQELKGA